MTYVLDRAAREAAIHGPTALARVDYLDGWRGLAILFAVAGYAAQGEMRHAPQVLAITS